MEQGSQEWLDARKGKCTASRIRDVAAKMKSGGYYKGRDDYMGQLIVERLTDTVQEGYINSAMQWGTDTEPQARAAYEFLQDVEVVEVGFIDHPIIEMCGASPDGLVGVGGLVEIKCPMTHTHIDTLLGKKVPVKYVDQIQLQLAVTQRQYCDFVSYDPRMPAGLQMFCQRIERDSERVEVLENEATKFLDELQRKIFALHETLKEKAA